MNQRVGRILSFALAEATPAVIAIGLLVLTVTVNGFGGDFRHELYPEAQAVWHGQNPFPNVDAGFAYNNLIWPIPAAAVAIPLTALPASWAVGAFAALMLLSLLAALYCLQVRDWRVYVFVLCWPTTISALQAGNITPLLLLLVAAAWRWRDRRFVPGLAIGAAVALKLFLWPMAVWFVVTRRWASAICVAAGGLIASLSVLPFTSLTEYARLMRSLAATFGPQSLSPAGFLTQIGMSYRISALIGYVVGAAILTIAAGRRSFGLSLAASLLLSPIAWLHYYLLLAVLAAFVSRRLSVVWLLPLLLWACSSSTHGSVAWQSLLAIGVLVAVTVWAERARSTSPRTDKATNASPSAPESFRQSRPQPSPAP